MTDFKAGDRVLIEATVGPDSSGEWADVIVGDDKRTVAMRTLRPWSERPYNDPELVVGMVVADGTGRRWHYLPRGKGDENPFWPEVSLAPGRRQRSDLPEQIRVVFDPQES